MIRRKKHIINLLYSLKRIYSECCDTAASRGDTEKRNKYIAKTDAVTDCISIVQGKIPPFAREIDNDFQTGAMSIKPCPFCGNEAMVESYLARKGFEATIHCLGCLAMMPSITYDTESKAVEEVVKDWNRRA